MGVRITLVVLGAVAGFVVVTLALRSGPNVEQLRQRCDASQPTWDNYSEDIKALGAGPVAQWRGTLISLKLEGSSGWLSVALDGPWRDWPAALPILLKSPDGQIVRTGTHRKVGDRTIYRFELPGGTELAPPPWIEVQYPHVRARLHLDASGTWTHGDRTGS